LLTSGDLVCCCYPRLTNGRSSNISLRSHIVTVDHLHGPTLKASNKFAEWKQDNFFTLVDQPVLGRSSAKIQIGVGRRAGTDGAIALRG
jgi:hypothetical protein